MRDAFPGISRTRGAMPAVLARFATLIEMAGVVAAASTVLRWISTDPHPGAAGPEHPPGSEIVVLTEITAIWVPQDLLDLARREGRSAGVLSPEELREELTRLGLNTAWYALTYRGHQINGGSAEMTQVRYGTEAVANIEEFRGVTAAAAGNPRRYENRDFLNAVVRVIPEALQSADALKSAAELTSRKVEDGQSPRGPGPGRNHPN